MQLIGTFRLHNRRVLTGIFKNEKEMYQAQEVLTDFGYPKDAIKVRKFGDFSDRMKAYGKLTLCHLKNKIWIGISLLGFCIAFSSLFTWTRFSPDFGLLEIWMMIALWVDLLLIGIGVSGLVGALMMKIVDKLWARKFDGQVENPAKDGAVVITVATQNATDARDIAREWENIGGEVIGPSLPQSA